MKISLLAKLQVGVYSIFPLKITVTSRFKYCKLWYNLISFIYYQLIILLKLFVSLCLKICLVYINQMTLSVINIVNLVFTL